MKTDDVKPGFTQLELGYNPYHYFAKYCEELNGKHYVSRSLYKQQFLIDRNYNIHGPCLSDNEDVFYYAACLHCNTWVTKQHTG